MRKQLELVRSGTAELPPGCEITYETEAIHLLRQLFPQRPDRGQYFYEDFRQDHGTRPLASETYHAGYNPRTLGQGNGGWVHFVSAMGDLSGRHYWC